MTLIPRAIFGTSARRLLLALWTTFAIIFVIETLIMVLLDRVALQSMWTETLVDSSLLTILAFPALYFFVFVPFKTYAARREQVEQALYERAAQLHAVLNSAPLTIFATDRRGVFTVSEGKGLQNVGLKPGENVGLSAFDLFGVLPFVEETGDTITGADVLRRALAGEMVIAFSELRGVHFENHVGPMFAPDGTLVGIVGVGTDITERKQAEARITQTEEKYRSIFENAVDGIYQTTPAGTFIMANPAMAHILGYASVEELTEQLANAASQGYADPQGREEFLRLLERDGVVQGLEYEALCKDGRRRWVSENARAVRNAEGVVQYYEGNIEDITERKRAQVLLQDSERLLRESQSIAGLGSYVLDIPTGRWRSSAVLDDILGIDERFDRSVDGWASLVHPDWQTAASRHLAEDVLATRGGFDLEYRIVRAADGEARWVHGRGELECDARGNPFRLVGTITDITERKEREQKLTLFRMLIDRSSDCIEVVDPDTMRLIDVNDRVTLDLGYSREELLNLTVFDIDPNLKRRGRGATDVEDQIRQFGHAVFETDHRRKDGSTYPVEINLTQIDLDRPYVIVVARDITARRAAEALLRLQSAALNATASAIVISDRDGTIEWVNAAATAMLGYEASELIGKNPRDVFKSGVHDREFYTRMWDTLLAGGVWRGEMINRRKDGSLYTDDMTITPIMDAHGAIAHFIAIKQDITDKKRIEDQLREQAELLDLAQDAIVVRDLEHRINYWNKGAERLYGLTAAEAMGRSVPERFYRDPAVFYRTHQSVLASGEWTGELTQLSADGREVTVESRWTLVRDRSGAPRSVLVINTDITERKKLEHQFLRAQRLESIGTLAGGIAHDLNNVLAPIMMSIDLLKMSAADDESRSLLDTIGASAKRGADIVGQVLSFARGLDGRRVEVQVKHLLREVEEIARETFPKDIVLRATASGDVWTVLGDPTQLHQVLLNLCINARDAMPSGGQITITATNATIDGRYTAANIDVPPGPYVVIQVEDTGAGIPPAIIDKIFDPFFTTKAVGKGTGLGLSTSLTIVKQHGGLLQVTSEPGAGTRFLIYLPAHMEGHDSRPDTAADLSPGHGETVLVVDDEAAIRRMMSRTLERFGYRVLLASEGTEALAVYAEHASEIAVLIIDMMMPGMDGASTIQALVQIDPAVRIIAVSGIADSNLTLPRTFAGEMQFLPKPHSTGLLLKTLQQVLAGQG